MTLEHSPAASPSSAAYAPASRPAPTLFEIRDEYLPDLAMRVSTNYYTGVKSRLAIMLAQIGNLPVSELRAMDVILFRNTLEASGASHGTCNSYTHHTFKAMLRWAYDAGLTASNPVHGLKRPPQSRDCATFRRRALTEEASSAVGRVPRNWGALERAPTARLA